jgi:hypothetical protein
MKERSLVDSIRAILGVLVGSIAWVVRLLFSMARDAVKGVAGQGEGTQRSSSSGTSTAGSAGTRDRDDDEDDGEELSYTHTEAAPGLTSDQHAGLGGVPTAPRMGDVAAANLSSMGSVYDEHATHPLDEIDQAEDGRSARLSEGIPNLDEPGDEGSDFVSDPGEVIGTDQPVTDYAGQPVSESDIGVEREQDLSDLADSPDNDLDAGVDAYDIVDATDTGDDEDLPAPEEGLPAASRGWNEEADDPLAGDPLYGDASSSETGEEADLRNDEMDVASSSGMHLVDSPDEPFIEDEPVDGLGLDAGSTDLPEIDDATNLESATIDETMLAADATGRPIGEDPASGDLGAAQSFDDTERPAEGGYEPGNVMGAYDGSGVDEFADDRVAEDLLGNVQDTDEQEHLSGTRSDEENSEQMTTESGDETTQSAAWASASGVVDETLTKPVGVENLSEGDEHDQPRDDGTDRPGEPGSGEGVYEDFTTHGSPSDAVRAPQYDPEDAGLRDVAAEIAEDIDVDGPRETEGQPGDQGADLNDPRTTTPSAPGQTDSDSRDLREISSAPSRSGSQESTRASSGGPSGSVRGDGTPNCPDGYPIKGNARSKIYHTPADSSYDGTIAEFCFATEDDARAAGFRPRKS